MYRKILAAVDEHVNSEVAARYAIRFAGAAGATLLFCHVSTREEPGCASECVEAAVARLLHRAKELGVEAEAVWRKGGAVEQLAETVRSEKADLVFAATRREGVRKRPYIGHVTRRLLVKLPCSVALVRVAHMGRMHPAKILVPLKARVDAAAERADFVSMLSRAYGSTVCLFHAPKPITRFFHGEVHLTPIEWEGRMPEDVSRFIEQLKRYGVAHDKRLAPGSPGRNITVEAAQRRHDLIVMGASRRGLFRSLLEGDPVEDVLRDTPCDLIIHKPGHED